MACNCCDEKQIQQPTSNSYTDFYRLLQSHAMYISFVLCIKNSWLFHDVLVLSDCSGCGCGGKNLSQTLTHTHTHTIVHCYSTSRIRYDIANANSFNHRLISHFCFVFSQGNETSLPMEMCSNCKYIYLVFFLKHAKKLGRFCCVHNHKSVVFFLTTHNSYSLAEDVKIVVNSPFVRSENS